MHQRLALSQACGTHVAMSSADMGGMPILKITQKVAKKSVTLKLASPVVDDLKAYAQFANGTINEVAQEALAYVFGRDSEFSRWKESGQSLSALSSAVSDVSAPAAPVKSDQRPSSKPVPAPASK